MQFEKVNHRNFEAPVVGVDEVGRGCLAGPVYAGAVCLKSEAHLELLTDSKLLSESRRTDISKLILSSHWVGIGSATIAEIDELNILQASLLAMHRAVLALEKQMALLASTVLIDGNQKIPGLMRPQTTIVKGDLRCAPISAASIVAKVARDELMRKAADEYPGYGFEKHKGYASEMHRLAIRELGPSIWHRRSFRGVKEFLSVGPGGRTEGH